MVRLSILIRHFHQSARVRSAIVPFKLADIGEGITEVELMKWFVKVINPVFICFHTFDLIFFAIYNEEW